MRKQSLIFLLKMVILPANYQIIINIKTGNRGYF
jgi:hypothetical protein